MNMIKLHGNSMSIKLLYLLFSAFTLKLSEKKMIFETKRKIESKSDIEVKNFFV